MPANAPLLAAQYLRMSTEHQQYSLDNQAEAIQRYADGHGFTVVKTYVDAGKSGLFLKHRGGLSRLLQDVVSGTRDYRAILVYDVSRWGRFQDADEAAHYEFLCKSAGIHVHYCAEQFTNDGTVVNSILKALKRSMAAEYSRELGVKTFEGKKRLVQLGFRVGGAAGYGFRRMLLSKDGKRKQQLEHGERKSLITDRVILVPGPKKEVEVVRQIFEMGLRKSYSAIAHELNSKAVPHLHGKPWNVDRVKAVLTNPKYIGRNVWARTAGKLRSCRRRTDPDQWIVSPTSFQPLVGQRTFDRVQAAHLKMTTQIRRVAMLDKLRAALKSAGSLSAHIVRSRNVPNVATYIRNFGSLRQAFELVGYQLSPAQLRMSERCRREREVRRLLEAEVDRFFPNQGRVRNVRHRLAFLLNNGSALQVSVGQPYKAPAHESTCWALKIPLKCQGLPSLLCLLDPFRQSFQGFYIIAGLKIGSRYHIKGEEDPLLQRAWRLNSLADLCNVENAEALFSQQNGGQ